MFSYFAAGVSKEKKTSGNEHENENENTKTGKRQSLLNHMKEVLESRRWKITRKIMKVLTILTGVVLLIVHTVKWFSLRITSREPVQSKIG